MTAGTDAGLQPMAWLFTRDQESIRVEVHVESDHWRLSMLGPGHREATRDFESEQELRAFQEAHEQQLRAQGYRLQAMAARRASARGNPAGGTGSERRRD